MTETIQHSQDQIGQSQTQAKRVLARLDSMMVEFQALRQEIRTMIQTENTESGSLADKLYGSLGQGTREELNYDLDINLCRFSDDPLDQ